MTTDSPYFRRDLWNSFPSQSQFSNSSITLQVTYWRIFPQSAYYIALVSLGLQQITIHRMTSMTSIFFLNICMLCKLKIMVLADPASARVVFLNFEGYYSCCILTKQLKVVCVCWRKPCHFIRALISFTKLITSHYALDLECPWGIMCSEVALLEL